MPGGSVPLTGSLLSGTDVFVLVGEDNEDDGFLLQAAFAECGIGPDRYALVPDGVEVLAVLRRQGSYGRAPMPTLVVLDIDMPRMDGFEVLAELKEDPALRHIPVVMLTSSGAESDVLRCYQGGGASFVTKPNRFSDLRILAQDLARYWTRVSRLPRPDPPRTDVS
jgi:two-component system response regulator